MQVRINSKCSRSILAIAHRLASFVELKLSMGFFTQIGQRNWDGWDINCIPTHTRSISGTNMQDFEEFLWYFCVVSLSFLLRVSYVHSSNLGIRRQCESMTHSLLARIDGITNARAIFIRKNNVPKPSKKWQYEPKSKASNSADNYRFLNGSFSSWFFTCLVR